MKLLLLYIYILATSAAQTARNVALGKSCTYCERRRLSPTVVDGIRDPDLAQSVTAKCDTRAFVDVDLEGYYSVHFVVLYEGRKAEGQLDYFVASVFVSDVLQLCSVYAGRTPDPALGRGLRANCRLQPPTKAVRIESRLNRGLELSEIEVYTLFLDDPATFHVGCFHEFEQVIVATSNLRSCLTICLEFSLAAMRDGNQCNCGHIYDIEFLAAANMCPANCYDLEAYNCGGQNAYSVYVVRLQFPHYTGCYKLSGDEAEVEFDPVSEPHECVATCATFTHAVVTNGSRCFCGNLVLHYRNSYESTDFCNPECSGLNASCFAPGFSLVFGTCRVSETLTLPCSQMNCQEAGKDIGTCRDDVCLPGFYGPSCILKDIDECLLNLCAPAISLCENTEGSYRCNCSEGYLYDYFNNTCVDEDECSSSCESVNEACTNTIGSYNCTCQKGFAKDFSGDCSDVDECESEMCDDSTSECVNTEGSYYCRCWPDYKKVEGDTCIDNATIPNESGSGLVPLILTLFLCLVVAGGVLLYNAGWRPKDFIAYLKSLRGRRVVEEEITNVEQIAELERQ